MKKSIRFLCYISVVILLISTISITSYAFGTEEDTRMIIDWENYLQPSNQSRNSRLYGVEFHLFTMEANRLSNLLSTYGTSKYFYGSSIPDTAILYYMGTLTKYSGINPSAGICYRYSDGYLHSVHETTFESGVWGASENIDASSLNDNKKYLGYIDGRDTGETSGSIQFWYWDD